MFSQPPQWSAKSPLSGAVMSVFIKAFTDYSYLDCDQCATCSTVTRLSHLTRHFILLTHWPPQSASCTGCLSGWTVCLSVLLFMLKLSQVFVKTFKSHYIYFTYIFFFHFSKKPLAHWGKNHTTNVSAGFVDLYSIFYHLCPEVPGENAGRGGKTCKPWPQGHFCCSEETVLISVAQFCTQQCDNRQWFVTERAVYCFREFLNWI